MMMMFALFYNNNIKYEKSHGNSTRPAIHHTRDRPHIWTAVYDVRLTA